MESTKPTKGNRWHRVYGKEKKTMIYSLCDIAGKDRATNKPIISIRAMDMEMQLLRYFRDYGLDNDPDWRESLDVILESQREDGCFL